MSIDGILCKYSEVFLKGGSRKRFINRLRKNTADLLEDFEGLRVKSPHGHIYVKFKEPAEDERVAAVLKVLQRVYGFVRLVPVRVVPGAIAEIEEVAASEALAAAAAQGREDLRFRLTVRRADKRYPLRSREIIERLGVSIFAAQPDFQVDLENFDWNLSVDVRSEAVYISSGSVRGAGGLPVGVNGDMTLLLSGGIDSPVAALLGMKRGCRVRGIFFDSFPLIGRDARNKVERLAAKIAAFQGGFELHVAPFSELQKAFKASAPPAELILLYRRSMYRLAERRMVASGDLALLTGDNLGQVSSQTLPNLHCLDDSVSASIIRPLITFDKQETVELSKAFGLYETSIEVAEDPCELFMPKHPQLRGRVGYLRAVEEKMGELLTSLEDECWARRERMVFDKNGKMIWSGPGESETESTDG